MIIAISRFFSIFTHIAQQTPETKVRTDARSIVVLTLKRFTMMRISPKAAENMLTINRAFILDLYRSPEYMFRSRFFHISLVDFNSLLIIKPEPHIIIHVIRNIRNYYIAGTTLAR